MGYAYFLYTRLAIIGYAMGGGYEYDI